MRRFIYSTKKVDEKQKVEAYVDGETLEPDDISDMYVVKIWHEVDPGADVAAPTAAEEIIKVRANSPDQAKAWAKMQWNGPIDRIEIVDVNPDEDEEIFTCDIINAATKSYADSKTVEDDKRFDMYKTSYYPDYDEDRINDLLAIDWNDVVAEDCEGFLTDTKNFPYLSDIKSVRYVTDEELEKIYADGYDGAFFVTYADGDETFVAWKNGDDKLYPYAVETKAEAIEEATDIQTDDEISFREWLDRTYYEGFDPSSLSDEEFFELEDQYRSQVPREQREFNYR